MKFRLPWPPTVNTYYAIYRGRKIMSQKGRDYKKTAQTKLHQMLIKGQIENLGDSNVSFHIRAFPGDKRKRDVDNILKALIDSCTGILFDDDSQITELSIKKLKKVPYGYVIVEIKPIIT
jgi:crossover junction endodeoxyribonuclease RusA